MSTFSFDDGDKDIKPERKRLAFKQETYRISLVWLTAKGWDPNDPKIPEIEMVGSPARPAFKGVAPAFVGGDYAYANGVGSVKVTPEIAKEPGLEEARKYILTYAIVWRTNAKGVVSSSVIEDRDFQIVPWRMNERTYLGLKQVHAQFPVQGVDLLVTCTDEKFQKLNIANAADNFWAKVIAKCAEDAELREYVQSEISTMGEKAAYAVLGREVSLREFREKYKAKDGTKDEPPANPSGAAKQFSSGAAAASVLDD
jgi:hypothetical protein